MNMGRGIVGRGIVGFPAPTNFCSACSAHVTRPCSSQTFCGTCQNISLSYQTASTVKSSDQSEDWEFPDDLVSDNINKTLPSEDETSHSDTLPFDNHWHVFGLPPTFNEAYAATSDLFTAFVESRNIPIDDDLKSTSSHSTTLKHEDFFPPEESNKVSDSEQEPDSGEWVEPPLLSSSSNNAMVQVDERCTREAMILLTNNAPCVQEAIVSIASDPDVWHAVQDNVQFQKLRHIFEKSQETWEEAGSRGEDTCPVAQELPSKDDKEDAFGGVFSVLCFISDMPRQFICQVQSDLSKFVQSVFSLLTGANGQFKNSEFGKQGSIDKAMRSTMMLAVLAIAVVLLKRLPINSREEAARPRNRRQGGNDVHHQDAACSAGAMVPQ